MILCLVATGAFSCTEDFEEMNTNPNRTTIVDPEALFMGSPIYTMMTFGSANNFWIFGNYSGQISMAGGVYPTYGSDGKESNMWDDLYLKCINPLVTIDTMKKNDPAFANRVAIARIWKAYIFSEMVALWGPLPYTKACKRMEYTPYDSESDIYKDLLVQLKVNADALNKDGDKYSNKKDPLVMNSASSDIEKWRKFAHSIRLRVASRLIDYKDTDVRELGKAALVEELNNPANLIISSNADNCYIDFTDNERSFWNPYFVYTQLDNTQAGGTYPVVHEQMLMYLIAYNDPRLAVFCNTADFIKAYWKYRGRPSTTRVPEWDKQILDNPHNNAQQDYYSYIKDEFGGRVAKWQIITYPEIACIRAEAVYRGFWGNQAEAKNYYIASINAFRDRYATIIPQDSLDKYQEHWGIKWFTGEELPYDFRYRREGDIQGAGDTLKRVDSRVNARKAVSIYRDYLGISDCVLSDFPADNPLEINGVRYNIETNANYKRIILQHWMALFFQGIDSWTLLRRTQLLRFTPVWFPSEDNHTSYTQQWAYLPQRLPYPLSEEAGNSSEAQKGIDMLDDKVNSIQAKLKIAKPVIDFKRANFPNYQQPDFPYSVSYK